MSSTHHIGVGHKQSKLILIVVVVLALLLGSWGVIRATGSGTQIHSYLASVAVSVRSLFIPTERIVITASPTITTSGTAVTLSWEHQNPHVEAGTYTFAYLCTENLSVLPTRNKIAGEKKLDCDTHVEIAPEATSLTIIPVLNDTKPASLIAYIQYIDPKTKEALTQGSTILVVNPEDSADQSKEGAIEEQKDMSASTGVIAPTEIPTKDTNTREAGTERRITVPIQTNTSIAAVTTPYGSSDLAVYLIDIGTLDRDTNEFNATTSIATNERIAIKFYVKNIGTGSTNTSWYFGANLPTFPPYIYTSDAQQKLLPGDRIEFTLGFDQVTPGEKTVRITIDPAGQITESDETNNALTVNINTGS